MSEPKDPGAPPGAPPPATGTRERRLAADLFLEDDHGGSTEPEVLLPSARAEIVPPIDPVPPTVQVPARDPLAPYESLYESHPRPSLPYISTTPSRESSAPLSSQSQSPPPLSRPPKLPAAITGIPLGRPPSLVRDTPEERERYEPPTQPIDLSGYQELPLPAIVGVPPSQMRPPSITEPPSPPEPTHASPPPQMPPYAPPPPPPARQTNLGIQPPAPPPPPPPPPPPAKQAAGSQPANPARASNLGLQPLPASVRQVIATAPPRSHAPAPSQPAAPARMPPSPSTTAPLPVRAPAPRMISEDRLFGELDVSQPMPIVELAAPRGQEPQLPASILVIDDDARAASELAARLLELGYTCRVARIDTARDVLGEGRFDAVVLEIPREEALQDRGRGRIALVGGFDGPIVVTSATALPFDAFREVENVAAALTKPYFVEVLVESIEAARTPKRRSAAERAPSFIPNATTAPLPSARNRAATSRPERRTSTRHDLDTSVVRAVISGAGEGQSARGRVRNISTGGGVMIETTAKLPLKTPVSAELTLYDGRMMVFTGRVARAGSKQDLALKLDVDDTQAEFLELYVADARAPDQRVLQPIRVTVREEGTAESLDDVALTKRWLEVSAVLDDNELQQRFIQECLKAGRLEFAVARYRDLKAQNPDDERPTKYLHQIGTILSFYALNKKDAAPAAGGKKFPVMMVVVIGMVILAAISLFVIMKQFQR